MYCSKCGRSIDGAVGFCSDCGEPTQAQKQQTLPSKKPGKNKIAAIIIALILAVLIAVFAFFLIKYLGHINSSTAENADLIDAGNVQVKKAAEITNPSESLDDMIFVINGVKYQFPLKLEDFTENGWATVNDDVADLVIEAEDYRFVRLYCGDKEMQLIIYNHTDKEINVSEGYVGEINSTWVDIILPGNITTHKSTRLEVKNALGMPNHHSSDVVWEYGEDEETDEWVVFYHKKPYVTLKFDETCDKTGAKDDDILKYVKIQWFNPDVENMDNEGDAE